MVYFKETKKINIYKIIKLPSKRGRGRKNQYNHITCIYVMCNYS